MLVNKSKAAQLAGVSRRTFYNHIPEKGISMSTGDDGTEKVDVSELKRVYGEETILRNLKKLEDSQDEVSNDVQNSHSNTPKTVQFDLLILREQYKALEEKNNFMETIHNQERERLQEEIDNLHTSLDKALDNQKQLLLLTDQREEKDKEESRSDAELKNLIEIVHELKAQNDQVVNELNKRKEKYKARLSAYRKKIPALLDELAGQGGDKSEFQASFKNIASVTNEMDLDDLEALHEDYKLLYQKISKKLQQTKLESDKPKFSKWLPFRREKEQSKKAG